MSRRCSVCAHSERRTIDRELVGGAALAALSRAYGLGEDALSRHRRNHLSAKLTAAAAAQDAAEGAALLDRLAELDADAKRIAAAAEAAGDLRVALLGIRELCRIVTLVAAAHRKSEPAAAEKRATDGLLRFLTDDEFRTLAEHHEVLCALARHRRDALRLTPEAAKALPSRDWQTVIEAARRAWNEAHPAGTFCGGSLDEALRLACVECDDAAEAAFDAKPTPG